MSSKSKKALASYGRSFVGAGLATFLATGGDIFALNGDGLKAIVSAGIAVTEVPAFTVLKPVTNALLDVAV